MKPIKWILLVALLGLAFGQSASSIEPGFCISGSKINDCTGEGLPGWTINLKDESGAVIDTTMTDANGDYSFCGLAPGTYTVCGVSMAGWEPVGPECVDVALESEDSTDINFYNAPSNHCPVTEDISYDTAKNKPITVSHAGTDEDGDTLTVAIETQPDHGTVVLNSDNTFTYTQTDHFFCGEDSFTYTVSDGKCDPVIGTITINVECPQDDAPGQTGENPGLSGDTGQGHDTIPGHTKRK